MHNLVDSEHSARPSHGRWHPRASTLALAMACFVAKACANSAADTGSASSASSAGSTDSTGESGGPTTSETSAPTTGETSAPTTSTTDGPECTVPTDCPGLDDACQIRTCEDGKCGHTVIESGKISLGGPPAVILASDPLDVHRYVAVATDLNGDDRSDLVVTGNTLLQTLSVLLGNGDGTFAARVDYPTRVGPDVLGCQDGMESSAVADLSGDGKPDVVVAGKCTVSVLRNNGDGSLEFTTRFDFSANDQINSVAAADLDDDGAVDLAVTSGPQTMSVLFNNGDGTFAPKVDYLFGFDSSPRSVAAADLDGDGALDLAVAHGAETVSLLLNDGDGGFAAPIGYITPKVPSSIAAADLNGDAWPDLAVAAGYDGNEAVSVLLNNGDGTLATRVDYVVASTTPVIAAADLDGDGAPELIRPGDGNGIHVLLNSGDGTFTTSVDRESGVSDSLAVAELNGDGKPDLALSFRDLMTLRIGNGDGTFMPFGADYPKDDGSNPSYMVAAADLNGDDKPDLAVTRQDEQTLSTLISNGDGTFSAPVNYPSTLTDPNLAVGALATADLNGDGAPDLTTLAGLFDQPSTVTVFLNNKDGTLAIPVNYAVGGDGSTNIATLDLNGDGKLDLAVANLNEDTVSVLRNSGDGTFVAPVTFATGDIPNSLAAADFDGDGRSDLAVTSLLDQAVNVLLNDGDGGFARVDYPVAELGSGIVAADLDGDGAPDLAIPKPPLEPPGPESVTVLLNNGDGTFAPWVDYPMRGATEVVLPVDLNGDGWPDLAASSKTGSGVSVRLNHGDGTFAAQTFYPTVYGGLGASADLNGDGRIDLVFGNERILFNTCL